MIIIHLNQTGIAPAKEDAGQRALPHLRVGAAINQVGVIRMAQTMRFGNRDVVRFRQHRRIDIVDGTIYKLPQHAHEQGGSHRAHQFLATFRLHFHLQTPDRGVGQVVLQDAQRGCQGHVGGQFLEAWSYTEGHVHGIADAIAAQGVQHLVHHFHGHGFLCFLRAGSQVWGVQHVGQADKGVVRGRWFAAVHVNGGGF